MEKPRHRPGGGRRSVDIHTPASFGPSPRRQLAALAAPGSLRSLRRSRHGHEADRRARASRDKPGRFAPTAPIGIHPVSAPVRDASSLRSRRLARCARSGAVVTAMRPDRRARASRDKPGSLRSHRPHCISPPASSGPSPWRQLAALAPSAVATAMRADRGRAGFARKDRVASRLPPPALGRPVCNCSSASRCDARAVSSPRELRPQSRATRAGAQQPRFSARCESPGVVGFGVGRRGSDT